MIDPNRVSAGCGTGPDISFPVLMAANRFWGCPRYLEDVCSRHDTLCIKKEDIKTMIQANPAKFLYLDEPGQAVGINLPLSLF